MWYKEELEARRAVVGNQFAYAELTDKKCKAPAGNAASAVSKTAANAAACKAICDAD
jgi:hypothetical protein